MVNRVEFGTEFIEPMEAILGRMGRSDTERKRAHEIWFHKLKEHSLDDIKKVTDEYLMQDERKFPSLGEVAGNLNTKRAAKDFVEKQPDDSQEWEEKAIEVMQSEIGQTAMREGWGYCLWCTVKDEKKTSFSEPEIAEFRKIYKHDVKSIIDLAAGRGEWAGIPFHVRKPGVGMLRSQWVENAGLAKRYLKEGEAAEIPDVLVSKSGHEPEPVEGSVGSYL